MSDEANEFYREKISILKEYVSKGEELLSSLEDWESLDGILIERDLLIKRLQDLEIHFEQKKDLISLNQEQKKQIDDLIKLISEIDQDSIKQIQEEQKKTLEDLRVNQKKQKIAKYEINIRPDYGTFLDTKN